MIHKVLQWPHDGLRCVARDVRDDEFGANALFELEHDLIATMIASGGVGLATTQLDRDDPVRAFAMGIGYDMGALQFAVLCNPEVEAIGPMTKRREGCVSFGAGRVFANVPSPDTVRIRCRNTDGTPFEAVWGGREAQAVWHEEAHLRGVLMIDALSRMERTAFLKACAKAVSR